MKKRDMQRLWMLVDRLTSAQRKELIGRLTTQTAASESVALLEAAGSQRRRGPHCADERVVRNGTADELQR